MGVTHRKIMPSVSEKWHGLEVYAAEFRIYVDRFPNKIPDKVFSTCLQVQEFIVADDSIQDLTRGNLECADDSVLSHDEPQIREAWFCLQGSPRVL